MKGDFTRNTFDPAKHFTRVLMQQGRVQLDAEWNEQAAILLHYLQTLAADLIGPHGGPTGKSLGFEIIPNGERNFSIGPGRYYVNGILCENDILVDENGEPLPLLYTDQTGNPSPDSAELEAGKEYLVYLDVWERHITYIEDDGIREVALGGSDTATRAKVVWQVKVTDERPDVVREKIKNLWDENNWVRENKWQPANRGELKAKAKEDPTPETDPCIISPEARYRGTENQLYRVEVHKGGAAGDATFKWSRDNGSVVFPIRTLQESEAALEHLGRDDRRSLKVGDWVEIVDDEYVLQGEPGPLLQVDAIDPVDMTVSLKLGDGIDLPYYDENSRKHPLLRRWDYEAGDPTKGEAELADDGALLINEDKWVILEDGVQICFQSASTDSGNEEKHLYRTGDYWLIPARTAIGDVEWPRPADAPEAVPPHGIKHHYAPLAIIDAEGGAIDCRHQIEPLGEPISAG